MPLYPTLIVKENNIHYAILLITQIRVLFLDKKNINL